MSIGSGFGRARARARGGRRGVMHRLASKALPQRTVDGVPPTRRTTSRWERWERWEHFQQLQKNGAEIEQIHASQS